MHRRARGGSCTASRKSDGGTPRRRAHRARVPTLRSAAALLAAAKDIPSLAPLAAAIGCDGAPSPLDADARAVLGIPDDVAHASVARGPDTLRALLLDVRAGRPVRE